MKDLVTDMATAGIHALIASRPDLTVEQLLVGIVRAARTAGADGRRSGPVRVAAFSSRPIVVKPTPTAKLPRKEAKRAPAKLRAVPGAARKPGRRAGRSPLTKRAARAKRKRPRLELAPTPPPKNFFRRTGKDSLVEALDQAVDGTLSKVLEVLDDGSPHLAALSRAAGRSHRWRFRSWEMALAWVCPSGTNEWSKVDPRRLATVSDHMRAALEATAGGRSELDRRGITFVDLRLPAETEAWIDYNKWIGEGGDAFVGSHQR